VTGVPIEANFQRERPRVASEAGIAVWGPVIPPEQLGIRGTQVAVDWDICTGCGICAEVCPKGVYEWVQTPGHPASEGKPLPARERKCVQCYRCETKCPVQAIRVVFPGPTGYERAMVMLFFAQVIGGVAHGILSGPALGFSALFWAGWILLAFAFPLFLSIEHCFKTAGKTGEGKSIMDTTVLVDTGTFRVVRHPQLLGGILMMFASILISQHWLVAIVGIPVCAWWYQGAVKEETGLLIKFGDDYRDYMERVPRMNILTGAVRLLKRRRRS
jgi:protein-S-isoprenylcysteine O-methyltransferase Ste14/NAD-dependent dihydropyrimidine dehydrogenase PreA subunit